MNHLGEKAMKVVFLIAACASVLAVYLCVSFCKWPSCNGKDWSLKIPLRNRMETDKR